MYERGGAGSLLGYYTGVNDFVISDTDTEVLRELAKKLNDFACRPQNESKATLWHDHNALRTKQPVIFCDPENGWNEIITQSQLKCIGELARKIEWLLLRELFWAYEMGDDKPIENWFSVPFLYDETSWGFDFTAVQDPGGGWHVNPQLIDYEKQMSQLKYPQLNIDRDRSDQLLEAIQTAIGSILKVRRKHIWWWSLATKEGFCDVLFFLRGLTNLMLDMYDHPDHLHELMSFLRDVNLQRLDYLEKNHLLFSNTDGTYVCSGALGYSDELQAADPEKITPMDMWGFSESQITVGISPEMFAEFILPYQIPLLERFGLNGYGCCENIDKRWDHIKAIPRLRRVSVSQWSDHDKMEELLGDKYIYSSKPSPSSLAVSNIDEDSIRKWLRREVQRSKNCVLEIVMKDNHTIGKNPQNVIKWCQIAREEIMR